MKTVTFICKYLGKGGAERVMSILINSFVKKGWNVQLILLYENLIEYPLPETVRIDYLGWGKYKSIFQIIPRLHQLRKTIVGDYVISFIYSAIRDTVFATIGLNKKIIISDRSDPNREPAGKIRQWIRTFSYLFADTIVFQTLDAKNYFPKIIQRKGVIIPNPISSNLPECFFGEREKVIVAAGRLDGQKNFPVLINAFSKLHEDMPNYVLKIYGQGPEEDSLKQLVGRLNLSRFVEFPGYVLDVDEKMRKAAIYVSSSDYEGISNSMLEALAMGVPTICTDCPVGGARETITDGIDGILIPVGDVESLYSAMKRVLCDAEFARFLSKNSVIIRQRLSEDTVISKWLAILE